MRRITLGVGALLFLGGCASTAHLRTDDLRQTVQGARDPEKIAVYSSFEAGGKEYQVLGQVIAAADAGDDAYIAVEKLRKEAAELGADAVVQLRLEAEYGNWNTAIKATATAVKYK